MAEQIYDSGSGYYNSQSRKFQPTLQIPMLESPALRGYVQDEMGRIKEDTKNVQSNISKYRKLKDAMTGLDLTPANLERFEEIRKQQYDIDDDLANIRAEEFANPVVMDAMEEKVDRLLKDPEVKRILGSEAYADKFREKTFQIGDQALRQKARNDYQKALEEGYESILSLNINNYKPMNPNEDILDLSKQLPTERVTQDGGDGYLYTVDRITESGLENLKKQMEYKYITDARFRNNFDAQYGQNYESVSDYIDNLKENGAFLDTYGKPKKIDSESGGQKLFKDIRKDLTGTQRDLFDDYTVTTGKALTSPAPDGLSEAIRQIAAGGDELEGDGLVEAVNSILNPSEGKQEEEIPTDEEGNRLFIEPETGNEISLQSVKDYAGGDDIDMSHTLGSTGYIDYNFGDGTKNSLEEALKKEEYKGSVDEEGNLITSNIRWLYEEYYGKEQKILYDDAGNLKELVDEDPNVEFIPKGKGKEAHFKIKGKGGVKTQNSVSRVSAEPGLLSWTDGVETASGDAGWKQRSGVPNDTFGTEPSWGKIQMHVNGMLPNYLERMREALPDDIEVPSVPKNKKQADALDTWMEEYGATDISKRVQTELYVDEYVKPITKDFNNLGITIGGQSGELDRGILDMMASMKVQSPAKYRKVLGKLKGNDFGNRKDLINKLKDLRVEEFGEKYKSRAETEAKKALQKTDIITGDTEQAPNQGNQNTEDLTVEDFF